MQSLQPNIAHGTERGLALDQTEIGDAPYGEVEVPTLRRAWQNSLREFRLARARLEAVDVPGLLSVVASGSMARMEMLGHSDLDLLVVANGPSQCNRGVPDECWEAVWTALAPLCRSRPQPDGIYRLPVRPAQLLDANERGKLSPDPTVFGQRIQLLLDGRPLTGASRWEDLRERVLEWFAHGTSPGEPAWSYLLDETLRYYRGLRIRERGRQALGGNDAQRRRWKFENSRCITHAAMILALGEWSRAMVSDVGPMLQLLQGAPLERLSRISRDAGCAPDRLLLEYDAYLLRLDSGRMDIGQPEDMLGVQAELQRLVEACSRRWPSAFRCRLFF